MPDIGPEHPLSYRREVAAPLFAALAARDSCAIVAPSSMGKSRLLQFVMRPDVQRGYLGEQADTTLLALADGNRLAEASEWGLYELLLTTLVEASGRSPAAAPLRGEINALRREAITSRDAVLARRHAELAAYMLCQEGGLTLALILDEFDEIYRTTPALALANLRALRDANKYRLCYALVLREHPARLRPTDECEGFYELFSRAIIGLGPYGPDDAGRVLGQLEARKDRRMAPAEREALLRLSGGHPGLLVALFDALSGQARPDGADWEAWALAQPMVAEECRKLWDSLADDERLALSRMGFGAPPAGAARRGLALKGLLREAADAPALFSPLFELFVRTIGAPDAQPLWVDPATRVAWIGERAVKNLTAREFDLLLFLYQRQGQVCTRDELIAHVYPNESAGDQEDNRMDTLIKRVREKIEPVRQRPRYLLTVRGAGYRLMAAPGGDEE